ncbi:TPA: PD-(D/E)XK nuclease-like domain-containing protein [Escherichia coli]|nr:PD-(D/E)XK nuclease-like domain-containing protein [Escherichia coli]HBE5423774.1 PD-(D/E)XK nuclease-like domain-containing protein [Escherichia coli]
MKPGIYFDISNEDYHAGDGVSKSQLDMVAKNPALLKWVQAAPEDEEKKSALDIGTALHCLLLEPGEFDKRFIVSPKFDRRTKQGKADEEAFLRDVADTSAAMNYSTVSELDKAYKYIAQKLSDDDELLAKATDVYSVRREELNETSM